MSCFLLLVDFVRIQEEIRYHYNKDTYINPFPWLDDFQLTLKDFFTRLKIVNRERGEGRSVLSDETIGMYQIFQPRDGKQPRTVLIEADPGMGKSTFCQKLCFDWSTGNTSKPFPLFELVLLVKCRDMATNAIKEAIVEQLLPEDLMEKSALLEYLAENPSKTLLVVDGLDELRKELDLSALIQGKILSRSTFLLVTTRHEAGIRMRQYCDSVLEITGYTVRDAKQYIRKYFKLMGKPDQADYLLSKIDESIDEDGKVKTPDGASLKELISNPLTTSLLCMVCEEYNIGDKLPSSRTLLYKEIISCILRRYFTKERQEVPEDPSLHCREDLLVLSELALQGLEKDQLHFDARELEGHATNVARFGFLSKESAASKLNPHSNYAFMHKTFQEYFAGLYLCEKLVSEEVEGENFIEEHSGDIKKLAQLFVFTAGFLAGKGAVSLLVSFVQSLARKLTTELVLTADVDTEQWDQQVDDIALGFLLLCDCVCEVGDGAQLNAVQKELCAVIGQEMYWRELWLTGLVGSERSVVWKVLCAVMQSNDTVEVLALYDNELTDVSLLVEALQHNTTLRRLYLDGNPIVDRTATDTLKQQNEHLYIHY